MFEIDVANDIISIDVLKTNLQKCINKVQKNNHPLIIIQRGRTAGVLISPMEYENFRKSRLFIDSVARGIVDSENKDIFSTDEVRKKISQKRNKLIK